MSFESQLRNFSLCSSCRDLSSGNAGATIDLVQESLRETGNIPEIQLMGLTMIMSVVQDMGCPSCASKWAEIME